MRGREINGRETRATVETTCSSTRISLFSSLFSSSSLLLSPVIFASTFAVSSFLRELYSSGYHYAS